MTDSLPEPPQLDPAALAGTTFSRGRKGFDPVEVNTAMGRAADALRTWELRDRQLIARIEALEAKLSESREMDEGRIASVLGEETARIITTARAAAGEIRTKAEDDAARLLKETEEAATAKATSLEEQAQSLQTEAQTLRDNATAETERLVAEARESSAAVIEAAEQRRDELIAAAAGILEERTSEAEAAAAALLAEGTEKLAAAEAEAASTREAAGRDAEAVLEAARNEGREMVAQAKAVREQILGDLAERRRIARQQIEAARVGRDAIVEMLRSAGEELASTADGLLDPDGVAQKSAEQAAGSLDDDTEAFLAELEIELGVDSVAVESVVVESVVEAESVVVESVVEAESAVEAESVESIQPEVLAEEDLASIEFVELAEVDSSNVVGIFGDSGAGETSAPADGTDPDVDVDFDDEEEDDDDDDDDNDDNDNDDDGEGSARIDITVEPAEPVLVDSSGATVHDLFARIRAEGIDSPAADDDTAAQDAPTGAVEAATAATATSTATATVSLDDLSAVLDRRDALLAPIEKQLLRSLRRLASDEQNETLDRLRRVKRGRPEIDAVLAAIGESTSRFSDVLLEDFSEAVEAGISFWVQLTGTSSDPLFDDAERTHDRLRSMVSEFITVHRAHLERAFSDAEEAGLDTAELGDSLSASYRDWRSNSLSELAGDLATAGFAQGERTAAGPGTPWRWVVDNGGLPCADGEDNALAGAVACEEPFPTGDITPPAHAGCRCLLVPAHQ